MENQRIQYDLCLFVAGDEPNSRIAKKNITTIFTDDLKGAGQLQIIDVFENFNSAVEQHIVLAPVLVVKKPVKTKIMKNLSDRDAVMAALSGMIPDSESGYERRERGMPETEEILDAIQQGKGDAVLSKGRYMVLRGWEAEDLLQQSEESFRRLADANLMGVGFGDTRGNVTYVNDEMLRMMGYTRSDYKAGRINWSECLAPEFRDDHDRWTKTLMQDGVIAGYERAFLRPDGGRTPYLGAAALVRPGADFHVSIALDMTEIHQIQAQMMHLNQNLDAKVKERTAETDRLALRLRQLAEKLIRVGRDERQKLSGLLHDHIQPLVVGARMQVWEIQRNTDPDGIEKAAGKLEDALAGILGSLRSLSVELSPAALQNNGLSGGLSWLKTYMQNKFSFTVHLTTGGRLEPVKEETAFLLFEGAKELLLNAAKHSGAASAGVMVRRTAEDLISIVVADQGRGFDPDVIRNKTLETATLGLFNIQERLASIDGRMLVETAPGRGTKVTLTAPAGKEQQPLTSRADPSDRGTPRTKGSDYIRIKGDMIGILIVDDHKVLREGLKGLLQTEMDFHVLGEAGSGKEALELAAELSPDVILMDINLGDSHGVAVTQQVISQNPGIRVIGLSMHDDPSLIEAMQQAGASDYLTKSAPSEKIVAAIRDVMVGR